MSCEAITRVSKQPSHTKKISRGKIAKIYREREREREREEKEREMFC
jgi:hypothetical protein